MRKPKNGLAVGSWPEYILWIFHNHLSREKKAWFVACAVLLGVDTPATVHSKPLVWYHWMGSWEELSTLTERSHASCSRRLCVTCAASCRTTHFMAPQCVPVSLLLHPNTTLAGKAKANATPTPYKAPNLKIQNSDAVFQYANFNRGLSYILNSVSTLFLLVRKKQLFHFKELTTDLFLLFVSVYTIYRHRYIAYL